MASRNFTNLSDHLVRARINFGSDTFGAILVTSVPSEANLDSWAFRNAVNNEVANGGGYSSGGFVVTASVGSVNTTDDQISVTFSASNPVYTNSTISAVGLIVYKNTGNAANDPLITFVDFEDTVVSVDGNYSVTFDNPLIVAVNPS